MSTMLTMFVRLPIVDVIRGIKARLGPGTKRPGWNPTGRCQLSPQTVDFMKYTGLISNKAFLEIEFLHLNIFHNTFNLVIYFYA